MNRIEIPERNGARQQRQKKTKRWGRVIAFGLVVEMTVCLIGYYIRKWWNQ